MFMTDYEKARARLRQADQDSAAAAVVHQQQEQGYQLLGFLFQRGAGVATMDNLRPQTPSYWYRVSSAHAQRPAIIPESVWTPAAAAADRYDGARADQQEAHAHARSETAEMPGNTTLRQTEYQRLTWKADKVLADADAALASQAQRLGRVYQAAQRVQRVTDAAPQQRAAAQAQMDAQLQQIDRGIREARGALVELVGE